ncbi:TPA: hypothetical protein NV714_002306 [Escherichia coli]|nr:hypothetical protein [Escherichia coli]
MRKLLSAAIICSILASPFAFSESEENTNFNPYSEVWKNQDSKEWGDTPLFVKTLVMRISDVYDKDKKENLVSPFSVIWLQQVLKEPKKYNLTKEDQDWIKTTLVSSAEKGSDQWRPVVNQDQNIQDNKDIVIAKSIENKDIEKDESPLVVKSEKEISPVDVANNTEKAEQDKIEEVKVVPEPKKEIPVITKKEENKVIEKIEIAKNDTEKTNKLTKNNEKENKNVIVMKADTNKGMKEKEILIPVEKVSNVNIKNENQSKIQAILNENNWLPSVIKQLLMIMAGMSMIFYMIFRNKNTKVTKGK